MKIAAVIAEDPKLGPVQISAKNGMN